MKHASTAKLFPADVLERAQAILRACNGNVGAYSHSQGIPMVRDNVAHFIQGSNE
jgi:alanine transaminase